MAEEVSTEEVTILLVEDNPGDVLLTKKALERNELSNELHVVEDGEQALAFLRREGRYADAPRPDLVLLDLNLPRKDGREVLEEVKSDEDLQQIPVVVMTSSDDEQDVLQAYHNHANGYVTKPVDLEQFMKVVRCVERFWLSIVRRPPRGKRPPSSEGVCRTTRER